MKFLCLALLLSVQIYFSLEGTEAVGPLPNPAVKRVERSKPIAVAAFKGQVISPRSVGHILRVEDLYSIHDGKVLNAQEKFVDIDYEIEFKETRSGRREVWVQTPSGWQRQSSLNGKTSIGSAQIGENEFFIRDDAGRFLKRSFRVQPLLRQLSPRLVALGPVQRVGGQWGLRLKDRSDIKSSGLVVQVSRALDFKDSELFYFSDNEIFLSIQHRSGPLFVRAQGFDADRLLSNWSPALRVDFEVPVEKLEPSLQPVALLNQ